MERNGVQASLAYVEREADTRVGTQSFNVSGRGEFWGLRGTYALTKWRDVNHQLSLAFDSRYFESSVGAGAAGPLATETLIASSIFFPFDR